MSAAADLAALALRLADVPAAAAAAAGDAVRAEALDQARRAAGGDLALAGKHRPIPLEVTLTSQVAAAGTATVRVAGTPTGPWRWIDTGTRPHRIRRRRRGPKSRLAVRHPGTAGKGAWRATVAAAGELARAAVLDTLTGAL